MNTKFRSDLILEKKKIKMVDGKKAINVQVIKEKNTIHSIIRFNKNFAKKDLKEILEKQIQKIISLESLKDNYHAFVVGIGNDSHTADSVGPKTLKHLKVNSLLDYLGVEISGKKVSSLEPGVLGETGIETGKIIKSVVDEIKPDIIFVIDAVVTESVENLNNIIEITNAGVIPGSGVHSFSSRIDKTNMGVPVIVIGVATAVEVKIEDKIYLLSTSDVDKYVDNISEVLGNVLNSIFYP